MVQDKRQAPGRAGTSAGSETAGGSGAEDPRCVRAAGDGIGRGVHRVVRTPGVARYAQARIGHRRLRRHRGHLDGRHARIVRGAGRKRTAGRHDATGAGQQPGEDLGVTGRLETQDTGDRIARVGDLTLAVGRLDRRRRAGQASSRVRVVVPAVARRVGVGDLGRVAVWSGCRRRRWPRTRYRRSRCLSRRSSTGPARPGCPARRAGWAGWAESRRGRPGWPPRAEARYWTSRSPPELAPE